MSERVPASVRWILALAARLAPAYRRTAWRRQWVAELEHRCSGGAASEGLIRFALGSIAHALYLRREEMAMGGWVADLRHSARALLRRPGFSALTVATLAVGIGASTAIFSLAETLVLRPLPMEDSDRLVRIFSTNAEEGSDRFSVSYPDYADFTERSDLFEGSSIYMRGSRDISGDGSPQRVQSTVVGEDFFQTLRSPVMGRVFDAEDHDPRNEITVVLAESFYVSRFGSDPAVIGSSIRLDGEQHTVVGVVADRFAWPPGAQLWTPLQWGGRVPEYADARSNHTWQVIARLQPGVDVGDASDQIRERARTTYAGPDIDPREASIEAILVPLRGSELGDVGPILAMLATAVFLVLIIACMNASGLLLTRAWSRGRELSLRSALGAGRARLMWILLGESAMLAFLGGALGVLLGNIGLRRAFQMAPRDVTDLGDPSMNALVLAAGVGISIVAALVAGGVPALRASRVSVAESLKEGAGQATQGRSGTRLRQGLVVAELAFSFALLVVAGLTIRGFQRQIGTDPGFEASNLLSWTVRLPGSRYGEEASVEAYYADAIGRLERHPGILAATSTSRLPLGAGGFSLGRSFGFEGAPDGAEFPAAWVEVDPEYFRTLGIRPSEGRAFTADDRGEAPLVAIVNERMARQMSPNESIVGRAILSLYDERLNRTVVGVIADIQFQGVSRGQSRPLVLVPRAQSVRTSMAFLVRTAGDPSDMIPVVRQTMAELDADVALDRLQSLRGAHALDLGAVRFLTTLFATFGVLALLLAVSGVYGLVSYSVSRRTQEIGVRMAMGATTGSVRRAVIRESAELAAIGLTIGFVLAYGGGRVLAAGMNGIATLDVSTYIAVVLLLAAAVLAASWFPATRATHIEPVSALRSC